MSPPRPNSAARAASISKNAASEPPTRQLKTIRWRRGYGKQARILLDSNYLNFDFSGLLAYLRIPRCSNASVVRLPRSEHEFILFEYPWQRAPPLAKK